MSLSDAYRLVAADLRRQRGLASLLAAFSGRHVDVLVVKGAALAYLIYANPHERPRCDADLLIRTADLPAAEAVLFRAGYRRQREPDAGVASGQRHYDPPTAGADSIDLHWRAVNPLAFASVLPFDTAWTRGVPVPALGPAARTLCVQDALLLACVHRAAHHRADDDLRWARDIDRLVRRLGANEADAFVEAVVRSRTRLVCSHVLRSVHSQFHTPVAALIARIDANGGEPEPSAAFIQGPPALVELLASDLRVATWRQRVQLIREHLLPSFAYMRDRYPDWPAPVVPLAYALRIAKGAPSWFRRPG